MKQALIKTKDNRISYILDKVFSVLIFIILIIFTYLILFHNLKNLEINDWDEARHGANAYEMIQKGNYIVTTYNYETDYWNLKPPLSEYFIILGYKLFGYNTLGLRFYSAVSMFICILVCAFYSYKKIGKNYSLWTILGFLIIWPIIFNHCARSGDADSLFLLFSTISIIGLLLNRENKIGFYISCLCFSFAFLTKSWCAAIIALIIIIYFFKNLKKLKFDFKNLIISILFATVPIIVWGIIRFSYDGFEFFNQMINVDLFNRSTSILENHDGSILYYYEYIINHVKPIAAFIVLICFAVISNKNETKDKIDLLLISLFVPLVLFSIAATKLEWYIYCIFPSIVLLSTYGIKEVFEIKNKGKYFIVGVVLFMSTFQLNEHLMEVVGKQSKNENYIFAFLNRNREYSDKDVYLYIEPNNKVQDWTQGKLLSVELAGNLKAIDGGYESWTKDDDSYLLIERNILNSVEEKYLIVEEGQELLLLKHQ